jgi:hypothetical protein
MLMRDKQIRRFRDISLVPERGIKNMMRIIQNHGIIQHRAAILPDVFSAMDSCVLAVGAMTP